MKSLTVIAASMLVGCAGQTDDGVHIALVPMRMLFQPVAEKLYDDDAALMEHAVRLSYGFVECEGTNAKATIDWIADFANQDSDNVSRYRSDVYVAKQDAPGLMENCHVVGSDVVSAGSFAAIFARPAKTQTEFEIQQYLWMAIRDTSDGQSVHYSSAFMTFLGENLGAEPVMSSATTKRINAMEAMFDPCRSESSAFDKTALFGCAGGLKAVTNPDELNAIAPTMLTAIKNTNDQFISLLDSATASAWKANAKVKSSAADVARSKYVQFDNMAISIDPPANGIPDLEDQSQAKEIGVLSARAKGVLLAFGLAQHNLLSPVVSVKNPRTMPLPPMMPDGTLAIPGTSDMSKAAAVPLSDGTYAVPNPSLHSDAQVASRWHHFTYVQNVGWQLVGHGGAPVYQPPGAKSNVLAALSAVTDVNGAATLSVPLPGATAGISSYGLRRKPLTHVVNNSGNVSSTNTGTQQLINMILQALKGAGVNGIPNPSSVNGVVPHAPTPTSTNSPTSSNHAPINPQSFGPSNNPKGFTNNANMMLPTRTPTSAQGWSASGQNSSGQTTSKQNYTTLGSGNTNMTQPSSTPDPNAQGVMVDPKTGMTSDPFPLPPFTLAQETPEQQAATNGFLEAQKDAFPPGTTSVTADGNSVTTQDSLSLSGNSPVPTTGNDGQGLILDPQEFPPVPSSGDLTDPNNSVFGNSSDSSSSDNYSEPDGPNSTPPQDVMGDNEDPGNDPCYGNSDPNCGDQDPGSLTDNPFPPDDTSDSSSWDDSSSSDDSCPDCI